MDQLPPLRLLTTFEAVSRHGSMRLAAARLNVSQPAISQALKSLEDHIGTALFDRNVRPARLTEEGETLARAVRGGLGQISTAIENMRTLHDSRDRHVTVSCTMGMATYWLMPRLPSFYASNPDITVNVQAPASDQPVLAPSVDIALRFGNGNWREAATTLLFREQICPVGAPNLIEKLLAEGTGLDAAPLIHVRNPNNPHWTGWEEYLRRRGIKRTRTAGQSFNNYVQAGQAVHDGRGLMLGWRSITGGAEKEGTLIQWPDAQIDPTASYYVTCADPLSENAHIFWEWLTDSATA